jgi:MYXO-CTERM domain-containing protein
MSTRGWLGTCCALATLLAAPAASAFCRTTTCDPNDPQQDCQLDDDGCVVTGKALGWRSSCVTVGVQQLGSPGNGFSYDDVATVVESAFDAWMGVRCSGKPPSIDVQLLGPVECGLSEYNRNAGNANIVLFRSGPWPYMGAQNALGLTTTRFDTQTGDLWDADIEINGQDNDLSIGDPITGDDLLSVLTHEAGHFLGLSHSPNSSATMKPVYDPSRDGASFRSLEADDIAGICASYPPDRTPATTSCENRHGFSGQCGKDQPAKSDDEGCSVSSRRAARPGGVPGLLGLFGLLALGGLRRARRSSATPSDGAAAPAQPSPRA